MMPTAPAPPSPDTPSLGRRILLFPFVRIVLAIAWVIVPAYAVNGIFRVLGGRFSLLAAVVSALLGLGLYTLFVRGVEQRSPDEVALRPAARETTLGFGVGVGLMSAVIGTLALLGYYHIDGHNSRDVLWGILAMTIVSGVLEEILLRAIVFRITEEGVGTIAALLLSAVLFGFLHAGNQNATLTSSVFIAVEAGTLLAAAYLWRRRLWLAIGLHAGWNFAQSGLWGVPVSGMKLKGILIGRLSGPEIVTGGAFGPEAGIVAMLFCLLAFAVLMRLALKREPLRTPAWMRRRAVSTE